MSPQSLPFISTRAAISRVYIPQCPSKYSRFDQRRISFISKKLPDNIHGRYIVGSCPAEPRDHRDHVISAIEVCYDNKRVMVIRVVNVEDAYQSFATPIANWDQGSTRKLG